MWPDKALKLIQRCALLGLASLTLAHSAAHLPAAEAFKTVRRGVSREFSDDQLRRKIKDVREKARAATPKRATRSTRGDDDDDHDSDDAAADDGGYRSDDDGVSDGNAPAANDDDDSSL